MSTKRRAPRSAPKRSTATHKGSYLHTPSTPPAAAATARLHLHKRRAKWFIILLGGLLAIQTAYNVQTAGQARAVTHSTAITHTELLASANLQRQQLGLADLALNAQLSQAAQAKADDMIAKNYWNHNAPGGTEPWAFITKAGYDYQAAGENLAYGFKTSDATVAAWMKSPTHKANLLGRYHDVGLGFATGDRYQNGENTVVVAFFGTPQTAEKPKSALITAAVSDDASPTDGHVLGVSVVAAGAASWGTYASLGFTAAVAVGFVVTHLELMRLSMVRAQRWAILHPLLDAIIVAVLIVIIIQAAGGFIG